MKKVSLITMFITLFISTTTFAAALFYPPVEYETGWAPLDVITEDFNGDGKIDIAVPHLGIWWYWNQSKFSVFIGNGDGTFQPRMDYGIGGAWSIASGDFNNDGKIDIACASKITGEGGGSVSIYIGNGDGTFQSLIDYGFMWGTQPLSIITGDFNGDAKTDLATAISWGGGTGSVSIFIGNGDGTFQGMGEYSVGGPPYSIEIGDFNADGSADLVTTNSYEDSISILIGNGDGTFQIRRDFGTGHWPYSVTSGDFNGDGKLDLAISNLIDSSVSVLMGNGDGTLRAKVDYATGAWPIGITSGDFNKDGKLDLVTASVLIGEGDGTFLPNEDYTVGARAIAVGDFNSDGWPDLAVTKLDTGLSILLSIGTHPPIANAGPDQLIECAGYTGALVTLDGSGSSDPDNDPLTYAWTWAGGSAEGVNPTVSLPFGTTVITLTISDGKATATDTVNLTVTDTTPPITSATGGSDNWYNANVISTFSAFDSCSGVKEMHYSIDGSETVAPGNYASITISTEGIHNVTYYAVDNAGNKESPKSMTVKIDKTPPVLNLSASPNILWPPDHKMVDVPIGGGASDNLSGGISVIFTVTDEYGLVQPVISGFNTSIPLEAWREGIDKDGRHYTIIAVATDAAGNKSTTSTVVLAPHDQR